MTGLRNEGFKVRMKAGHDLERILDSLTPF